MFELLRIIGAADLSVGRLFEGHVNAVTLVARYGNAEQLAALAAAARDGEWSGVWNAEDRARGLTVEPHGDEWRLHGCKMLCSGAGSITRPLVVGTWPTQGPVMLLPRMMPGERADLSGWTPLGMRSTATGTVDLSGLVVGDEQVIGQPGDYFREPLFKGGGWRFCAVQVGGIDRLIDLYRIHLRTTDRGGDPFQAHRFAQCCAAGFAAATSVQRTAERMGRADTRPEDAVALTGLTRFVVERHAMEVIDLVQRGVGLRALIRPSPIERVIRDLSTYLRQPAPDTAMTDAARHVLARIEPAHELWSDS